MDSYVRYLLLFFVFAVIGWFYENKIILKDSTDTLILNLTGLRLPLLTIYGIGGVIVVYMAERIPTEKPLDVIRYILLITIIINLLECIVGQMSLRMNKYRTWNYDSKLLPACDGYVSLTTFVGWTIAISIIVLIIYVKPFEKII